MAWPPETLIVDDTAMTVEALRRRLTSREVRPDIARDGLQARLAIQRKHYDLVFLDINMPIMNGFEVVQALREEIGPAAWVVGMSASTQPLNSQMATQAGFNEFYEQPLTDPKLDGILDRFR